MAELSVEYDRWISAALLWLIYRLRHNAVDQDSELLILMQISYWSVTNAEKFWAMCKVTMCGSIIYPIRRLSYLESEPHINHDVTPYFAPPFEQLFAQCVKTLACMYRRNRSHTLRFLVSCWKDIVRPPTKPIISQWRCFFDYVDIAWKQQNSDKISSYCSLSVHTLSFFLIRSQP